MEQVNRFQPSMSSAQAVDKVGMKCGSGFRAFTGTGHRLDGKSKSSTTSLTEVDAVERSLPQLTVNTNYSPGKLEFVRSVFSLFVVKEKICFSADGLHES